MIFEITDGCLVPKRTLTEVLGTEDKLPRIAAVGAGGKTTVLKLLAEEYRSSCLPVVLTTTTHMKREESSCFLENPSFEEIAGLLRRRGFVFAGSSAGEGKIGSLPGEILRKVFELPCPVLLEADGAKGLPVKAPAEHEPVLPVQTTCVLSVYGLDAVGKSIHRVCFRPERTAELLGKSVRDTVEPEDIAALAFHDKGGRKCVKPHMKYVVVLNKADTEAFGKNALKIWKASKIRQGISMIVMTDKTK